MLAHNLRGANWQTLQKIYRALIKSKIDYGSFTKKIIVKHTQI